MKSLARFYLPAVVTLLTAAIASAQPQATPGPVGRPAFSPYLNLLNNGTSPAANYLGFVRPQQQAFQQLNQLTQQYNQTNAALQNSADSLAQGIDPNVRFTGNVATFNNTRGYFSRHPVNGGGGLRSGGGGGVGSGGFGAGRSSGGGMGGGAGGGMNAPRGGSSPSRR